jgi:hypothetical protein
MDVCKAIHLQPQIVFQTTGSIKFKQEEPIRSTKIQDQETKIRNTKQTPVTLGLSSFSQTWIINDRYWIRGCMYLCRPVHFTARFKFAWLQYPNNHKYLYSFGWVP